MYDKIFLGPLAGFAGIGLIILIFWSIFWKGLALWKAAKNNQKYWFVAILIVNSIGLLSILYLAFFQQKRKK